MGKLSFYEVYLPLKDKKVKSKIRGFWRDNNKTYYDYIRIIKRKSLDTNFLMDLCEKYKQFAIFYEYDGKGYIFNYDTKKTDILNDFSDSISICFWDMLNKIKHYIVKYGGVTVYIKHKCYYIKAWHN